MIANSSKFHAIVIRKDRKDPEGMEININGKVLKTESEVVLLGITLVNGLTFDIHIGNICKKAANQLHSKKTCILLKLHVEKNTSPVFHYIEFNYCPAVWHLRSTKNLYKMERIKE